MGQLTTSDAGFLSAPDPDQHASLAIGAVAVVDGAVPDYERFKSLLAERIKSIPRCAQVLRTQWIDYPEFDVAWHVRRVALPRPGDDAELSRAIAHALERPLDPDRPLWECWVIEGLADNQWAMLMKLHPGLADDGISAAHLLTRLCDDAERDLFANHLGSREVSASRGDTRSWADTLSQAGKVAKAVGTPVEAIWPWARMTPAAAVTMRRYHTLRVRIADVDRVCRKFGVTSTDVALAAVTEGFRAILLHRGEQPRADSLRTLSAMLPYLPVHHEDPVQRLRLVHHWLTAKPSAVQHQPGLLESALNCLPIGLRRKANKLLTQLPRRGIVTLATNLPGPRHRLLLMGQSMERVLPIPPTALQLSTGVAVLSYGDELVFGITAEYDAAPDVKRLADGIESGMARLVALSQDSVLLFTKDRPRPGGSPRRRQSPGTARARR